MAKKWQDFERIIAAIHADTDGAAVVTWNDEINGRQFDVSVRFKQGLHEYLTVIECKDYAGKVPVEKVDAFVTKTRDINANKAIIVAANGFQSGCMEAARRHGITLLTLHESIDKSLILEGVLFITILNIYRVRLVEDVTDREVEFEEWNGKLEYLMGHCELLISGTKTNPTDVINQWRRENSPNTNHNEARFEIALPLGTIAKIPFEAPIQVSAIRFHCKEIPASLSGGDASTRHLRELSALQHELHNCITGEVIYKESQSSLNLGFDSKIEVGKFYHSMHGIFYYYCEEIVEDLVTWILLESYQHGKFIQAKFTQRLEHAKNYVQEKEENKLAFLSLLLADYNLGPKS
jgi:hypothetical protein